MKSIFLFLSAFLTLNVFSQQVEQKDTINPNAAEISFENESHDFGLLDKGTPCTYAFIFKNIGKEPLVLSNVRASCGCTTPSWPKEPIAPGAKSEISVKY